MNTKLDPSEGIALFTDGSVSTRSRAGGWAWVAIDIYGNYITQQGRTADTTSNRMEMTAAIQGLWGLHNIFGTSNILVYSDSQIMVYGCNRRYRRNANLDLWGDLDHAIKQHQYVEFNYIKGHHTSKWNNMADRLAIAARKGSI